MIFVAVPKLVVDPTESLSSRASEKVRLAEDNNCNCGIDGPHGRIEGPTNPPNCAGNLFIGNGNFSGEEDLTS